MLPGAYTPSILLKYPAYSITPSFTMIMVYSLIRIQEVTRKMLTTSSEKGYKKELEKSVFPNDQGDFRFTLTHLLKFL